MIQELVTRQFAGHDADGNPVYNTTHHSVPRPPETLAEWIELRVAYLGPVAAWGSGRVLAGLLEATDDKAVQAAVDAGGGLDPWQRWHITQDLQQLQETAGSQFPPAAKHLAGLINAWTGRHGSGPPKPRHGEPIGGKPLPAAGTGAAEPRWGCAPVQG